MIIVSQYGGFHGRHGAEAAFEASLLKFFASTNEKYVNIPKSKIYDPVNKFLLLSKIINRINHSISNSLSKKIYFTYNKLLKEYFDKCVALKLNSNVKIFHSYSSGNEKSLEVCKQKKIFKILDYGIAHPFYLNDILNKEYKKLGLQNEEFSLSKAKKILDTVNLYDKIIIPSQFVYETFISNGFDKHKLEVIPYGVDLDIFSNKKNYSDTLLKKEINIGFTGMYSVRKGTKYLLDVIKILKGKKNFKVNLNLYGYSQNNFKEILKSYKYLINIDKSVEHHQLINEYKNLDILILPSLAEGMARVVLEAMACGVVCIVSKNTGYAEHIKTGVNGYVVEYDNVEKICYYVEKLINDRNLIVQISKNSILTSRNYSWKKYKNKLREIYKI